MSNSGTITTLTNRGTINGVTGVSNAGTIETLTNSDTISGYGVSGRGGAGVSNGAEAKISNLTNGILGTIMGGSSAGAGVSNSGMITTLANSGAISGGYGERIVAGGAGVSNAGTITTLNNSNSGKITGGLAFGERPTGGAGVSNAGTITTLNNSGAIGGGRASGSGTFSKGVGGAGVSNSGTIRTLSNSGRIRWRRRRRIQQSDRRRRRSQLRHNHDADQQRRDERGRGRRLHCGRRRGRLQHRHDHDANQRWHDHWRLRWRQCSSETPYAVGGAGVLNSGTIGTLTNNGTIRGGAASAPHGPATPGDAILQRRRGRLDRADHQHRSRSSAMSRSTISRA